MTHPEADHLLGFVLDTLDTAEARRVTDHLSACPECRRAVERLRREVDTIASAVRSDPEGLVLPLPAPERPIGSALVRAAAVLVLGFLLGYASAVVSRQETPPVVTQQFRPLPMPVTGNAYVPCEGVDLGAFRDL